MHYLTAILIYCGLLLAFEPGQAEEAALEAAQSPASLAAETPADAPGEADSGSLAPRKGQEGRTAPAEQEKDGRGERIRTSDLCNPIAAR